MDDAAPAAPGPPLALPFARRDLDRLRLILLAQKRLRDLAASPGAKHALASRGYFEDAVRWIEIHGGIEGQELAAYWRSLETGDVPPPTTQAAELPEVEPQPRRRRRRRRRRGPRPAAGAERGRDAKGE